MWIKFLKLKIKQIYMEIISEYKLFIYAKTKKCNFGKNMNFSGSLENICIGKNTTINGNANFRFKNGHITIGNDCLIARNTTIITQTYELDAQKIISQKTMYVKDVIIGNGVWIGSNTIIMPGVTVGNYAVVGAGSIVTKNIQDFEIWAGVPAKKIRDRIINERC